MRALRAASDVYCAPTRVRVFSLPIPGTSWAASLSEAILATRTWRPLQTHWPKVNGSRAELHGCTLGFTAPARELLAPPVPKQLGGHRNRRLDESHHASVCRVHAARSCDMPRSTVRVFSTKLRKVATRFGVEVETTTLTGTSRTYTCIGRAWLTTRKDDELAQQWRQSQRRKLSRHHSHVLRSRRSPQASQFPPWGCHVLCGRLAQYPAETL